MNVNVHSLEYVDFPSTAVLFLNVLKLLNSTTRAIDIQPLKEKN